MTDEQLTQPTRRVTYLPMQRATQARSWHSKHYRRQEDSRWAADEWATVVALAIVEEANARLDVAYVLLSGTLVKWELLVEGSPHGTPDEHWDEGDDQYGPIYWEVRELIDGEWWNVT